MLSTILIVEDENKFGGLLSRIIEAEGYNVLQAQSARSALKLLESEDIRVVINDVKLPDANGVELVKRIKDIYSYIEVINLTAFGSIKDSVKAIKNGAFDYIMKGDDNDRIIPIVNKAVEKANLQAQIYQLEKKLNHHHTFDAILGKSPAITEAIVLAQKVAHTNTTVLLLGETGTGKEIFAQAIHQESERRGKPFVAVNYHQQLNFKSNDEFGELGQAFNTMTRKLDEYEHSNLASILFEKKRIETIINSMHDAIIGLDEKQFIIFANEVASTLIGLPAQSLTGKYAPDIAMENDLLRNLLVNDQHKMKIYADNRESFYTKEVLSVTSKDKVIGKVIILKNITEFQQLDEAKTNFIATISHELKTPISSIKMSLKLLEDKRIGEMNTEQQQLLENIDEDARRLLQITGELLDMAQVETRKLKLNFGSTHPINIVDYAVKALKSTADQKHVTLHVECDERLPDVHADLDKTTWVLINLLSNAIKYSHEKSVVDLVVKKHKGEEIEFSVQDQGRGIDQKYLSRIFERYFKVPGATFDQTGTGLGLAIAKDFTEAQAGKIGVESETGEGSRFYFTLKVSQPV